MARRLRTNAQIDTFIGRVIGQAQHHAPWVETVIEPLSDEVRERLDLSVDKIEVYERNGQLARTCWVTIGGHRYAFSYAYRPRKIELRDGSTQGTVIYSFDNNTPLKAIARVVARL